MRNLCLLDLFFLLRVGMKREDMHNEFALARCREVQKSPDGRLDLWAREHYKSSIITIGFTILEILRSHSAPAHRLPEWGDELTFCIFSFKRPIAKAFLRSIKEEFERNELLKELFPDVLYANPKKEAPKWSEDDGIVVKRAKIRKEQTVEASGLVDGQPTSKHFDVLIYDDIVTLGTVGTAEMINKTTHALKTSYNIGTRHGKQRMIGTRYHALDPYAEIIRTGSFVPRIHPATIDGEIDGEPVLLTADELAKKRVLHGDYVFGCQMLMNPTADVKQGFKVDWFKFYEDINNGAGMNLYILVDPAGAKKRNSDYTAVAVIGLGADENIYLVDLIRDRLNLKERTDLVFRLHRKWSPLAVGYEKYGLQSDIEHIELEQERENYRFNIEKVGGSTAKNDRIRRLVPYLSTGRFYIPKTMPKTDSDGRPYDVIKALLEEEVEMFPVAAHDDMLDAISRIFDVDMKFPKKEEYAPFETVDEGGWMG